MFHRIAVIVLAIAPNSVRAADDKEPLVLEGHTGTVGCVAFVGNGKVLASAGADKTVRLWDSATGKEIATLKGHAVGVQAVAGTPDGKLLASGDDDGVVKVWDVASGKELLTLKGQKGDAAAIVFAPDGKTLAVGGGGFDKDAKKAWGEIRLWDTATGKQVAVLDCEQHRVFSVVFSPDGKSLASCSSDGSVIVWDAASGKKTDLGKNPQGGARVAFSPDGKTIVCGNFFGTLTLKFWDTATGKETKAIETATRGSAFGLAFLPDGKTLVVGGMDQNGIARDTVGRGAYLALWDVETGKVRLSLKGHQRAILSVGINPDGTRLAAAGMDGKVRVWELPNPKDK